MPGAAGQWLGARPPLLHPQPRGGHHVEVLKRLGLWIEDPQVRPEALNSGLGATEEVGWVRKSEVPESVHPSCCQLLWGTEGCVVSSVLELQSQPELPVSLMLSSMEEPGLSAASSLPLSSP